MKTIKALLAVCLLASISLHSQNITNTLGTSGTFTIKSSSTNLFTISQSNAVFFKNIELGNIGTSTSTAGMLTKNGVSFLHNYAPVGADGNNTFVGLYFGNQGMSGTTGQSSNNTGIGFGSLFFNTTGSRNTGLGAFTLLYSTESNDNTSVGYRSLNLNTTGSRNTAVGSESLINNTTGQDNSALGYGVMRYNIDGGDNTSMGSYSMYYNTTGSQNTAVGFESLISNTTGSYNTALGSRSMRFNTSGEYNTAVGFFSLSASYSGTGNSVLGYSSLAMNIGNYNSAFGYRAGDNIYNGSNNTTIGYNAQVPSGTANNQVRIGNTNVTYAGIQVAWTVTSDRRLKKNILSSNLGLSFINKLRPVSYIRINDESGKTEYGLIAQEVEDALKLENTENTGMLTVTDEGEYQLRYNDLLAPMIKAIQELKAENEELKKRIEKLEEKNTRLTNNK